MLVSTEDSELRKVALSGPLSDMLPERDEVRAWVCLSWSTAEMPLLRGEKSFTLANTSLPGVCAVVAHSAVPGDMLRICLDLCVEPSWLDCDSELNCRAICTGGKLLFSTELESLGDCCAYCDHVRCRLDTASLCTPYGNVWPSRSGESGRDVVVGDPRGDSISTSTRIDGIFHPRAAANELGLSMS